MPGTNRRDAVVPLSLVAFGVLLFAIPARFVVPGFGAAGAPASLLGVAMLGLVVLGALAGRSQTFRWGPIPVSLLLLMGMLVAGIVNGRTRPISALSASTSDRTFITLLSLMGVAFFVLAHVRSPAAVRRMVDVMLLCSMLMCAVGLVQFYFGLDLTRSIPFPGLVANSDGIDSVQQRSIFNRPFGTALHPIEFGVVTASLVPLALARSMKSPNLMRRLIVLILAFSALTSISRSAVLTLAVGALVFLVGLQWRQRFNLAVGGMVFIVVAGSVVPGLIGTLRQLFVNSNSDPSVQARIDRVPEVLRLVSEYPWFGRGYGVFTPSDFLLLDNEIQKLAVEIGVIGLGIYFFFVLTMVWTAVQVGQRSPDLRLDAYALLAANLGFFVSYYTFDASFYHILTSTLFLNIGLIGVLWNAMKDDELRARSTLREDSPSSSGEHRVRPDSDSGEPTGPTPRTDSRGRRRDRRPTNVEIDA